jgi:hypothetical protein
VPDRAGAAGGPAADRLIPHVTSEEHAAALAGIYPFPELMLGGAGGRPAGDKMDHGFMYGWSFLDVDGHHFEVMWMDPAAIQK